MADFKARTVNPGQAIDLQCFTNYNRNCSCKFSKGGEGTIVPRIAGLWMGIIAIVVGILIIVFPHLLSWILGIALIVMGVMAVIPALKR